MKQTRLWMFAAILTLLCGDSAMHNYCLGNKKYKNRLHLRITTYKSPSPVDEGLFGESWGQSTVIRLAP